MGTPKAELVVAGAVRATVAGWRPGRVAIANYHGQRGHPTVMSPQLWSDSIAAAAPDEGARSWLAEHADLVDEVDVTGDPSDLDTPEDLRRWSGG
jgi:CTP:molybdopterin cytidylyltransferase MocA